MKFKAFFTLLLIIAAFKAGAQQSLSIETIDSTKVVTASIRNLKTMLKMTFDEWEGALTKLDYGSKSVGTDNLSGTNIFLLKNFKKPDATHQIIKNEVSVSIAVSGMKNPDEVFKKLKAELKPFYKGIAGDSPVYQVKENGVTLQYIITKYEGGETVIIRKA